MTLVEIDSGKTEILPAADTFSNKEASPTDGEAMGFAEQETVTSSRSRDTPGGEKKGVSPFVFALVAGILFLAVAALGAYLAYTILESQKTDASQKAEIGDLRSKVKELERQMGFDKEMEVRVNTPFDGFLALRTAPDVSDGKRIAKIPHRSVIGLGICRPSVVVIGRRQGKWCRARYKEMYGWVFDAWVDR